MTLADKERYTDDLNDWVILRDDLKQALKELQERSSKLYLDKQLVKIHTNYEDLLEIFGEELLK